MKERSNVKPKALGGDVDVSVARAVCALLMGDPLVAEAALCMVPGSAIAPDNGVAGFILVRAHLGGA